MRAALRPGALAIALASALASARACVLMAAIMLLAQTVSGQTNGTAVVTGPAGNPIRDGTPAFTITTSGFLPTELPLQIELQVATAGDFSSLFADTTVVGTSAAIVIPRLLPQKISIWWRAKIRTAQGVNVITNAIGPRQTSAWLTLISPNGLNGSTVDTILPTFLWTAVATHAPVSQWTFAIDVTRTSDAFRVIHAAGLAGDTTFVPFEPLETNTSYFWAVSGTLSTGDSVHVVSFSTFVILSANAPIATVLYQNFPDPFPNARIATTCIWFDLKNQSAVHIDILDLRGNHVARITPGRGLGPIYPPGRYGRAAVGSDSGCDDRLTWDGRDDSGRTVPPGVYLVRFVGDGLTSTRKLLFKGR
jgi:hypothetical protein